MLSHRFAPLFLFATRFSIRFTRRLRAFFLAEGRSLPRMPPRAASGRISPGEPLISPVRYNLDTVPPLALD